MFDILIMYCVITYAVDRALSISKNKIGLQCRPTARTFIFFVMFSTVCLFTTFSRAASRCMRAAKFGFGWLRLAVLYWVFSRFLARLFSQTFYTRNRKIRPYHRSRLGGQLPSRTRHSCLGSTKYHVRGLNLDHQSCPNERYERRYSRSKTFPS